VDCVEFAVSDCCQLSCSLDAFASLSLLSVVVCLSIIVPSHFSSDQFQCCCLGFRKSLRLVEIASAIYGFIFKIFGSLCMISGKSVK